MFLLGKEYKHYNLEGHKNLLYMVSKEYRLYNVLLYMKCFPLVEIEIYFLPFYLERRK